MADKLVQIGLCHGFDGWLVNIENPLSVRGSPGHTFLTPEAERSFNACCYVLCFQAVAVGNTPLFLRYLTDQMHERVSGSLVLWYDSVTEDGQLKWQNELNQSNRSKR